MTMVQKKFTRTKNRDKMMSMVFSRKKFLLSEKMSFFFNSISLENSGFN